MCSLNSPENLVEWAGKKVGEFYLSNPYLHEFFMKILDNKTGFSFKRKDEVILCLLEFLESGHIKIPALISKESYEKALETVDSLGKELYQEEAKIWANDERWLGAAYSAVLIQLRIFSKEDREKAQILMGGLFRMFRLEEEKCKKP